MVRPELATPRFLHVDCFYFLYSDHFWGTNYFDDDSCFEGKIVKQTCISSISTIPVSSKNEAIDILCQRF